MPYLSDTRDLESFATALADELPGTWTSQYHRHEQYPDQFPLAENVWDMNLVSGAIAERVLEHDAVLTRDDGARLYVIGAEVGVCDQGQQLGDSAGRVRVGQFGCLLDAPRVLVRLVVLLFFLVPGRFVVCKVVTLVGITYGVRHGWPFRWGGVRCSLRRIRRQCPGTGGQVRAGTAATG
jgi:hypothetical protein